jgi:hypothetical protein
MSPLFVGLRGLGLSLGITDLTNSKDSDQSSTVPTHLRILISTSNTLSLISIALCVVLAPILVSLVFKVLSKTVCRDNRKVERAWKYSLGTFTFYGLLYLAYGEFACLAFSLKYFAPDLNSGMGVMAGGLFGLAMVVSVIASCRAPEWYGCFRKKFFKYEVSQYFYAFSSAERLGTASLIVLLSPGCFAAGAAMVPLLAESIFIIVKKPYVLGQWKRPLLNKVIAVIICLLYAAASLTTADGLVYQLLPLTILVVLLAVTVVTLVGAVQELRDYWGNHE